MQFMYLCSLSEAFAFLNICYRQGTNIITPAVQDAADVIKCSQKEKKCICKVSLRVSLCEYTSTHSQVIDLGLDECINSTFSLCKNTEMFSDVNVLCLLFDFLP